MGLVRLALPELEPLDLSEVRLHLRIDHSDEDTLLASYVRAARERAEDALEQSLITQGWRLVRSSFSSGDLVLPRGPIQSVDLVRYVDADGISVTMDPEDYEVDTDLGAVRPVAGRWPRVARIANAVAVHYVAGYGADPQDVPGAVRLDLMRLVGHWYLNRESTDALRAKRMNYA
jgi:uncharacterized phiE125 gp8 family phage protein